MVEHLLCIQDTTPPTPQVQSLALPAKGSELAAFDKDAAVVWCSLRLFLNGHMWQSVMN